MKIKELTEELCKEKKLEELGIVREGKIGRGRIRTLREPYFS